MTYVVVRTTLKSREDSVVDLLLHLGVLVLAEEDETSTRTTEGLVGGGADKVTLVERVLLNLSRDETRDVGHVHEEVGALAVGNLAQALVVPVTRVGGGTADDKAGLEEVSLLLEELVVDQAGVGVDLVGKRLVVDGGGGDFAFLEAQSWCQTAARL